VRAKTELEHHVSGTRPQLGRYHQPTARPSVYAGGRPKIPAHLDKLARAEFKRVCQALEQRKTLTPGDRLTIAVLAECYSRWCQAKQKLGSDYTITITDGEGNSCTKTNPLVKIVEVCEARLLSLQNALGLTPAARDKVRQTGFDPSLEVIEGSIADKYSHLFNGQPEPESTPMLPAAVAPADMVDDEDAPDDEETHAGAN
jgi:P27 family predicted phage terminase small subunit